MEAIRRDRHADQWPAGILLVRKGRTTVSVVTPAWDEEATIGSIGRTMRHRLVERLSLVDELLVVDSCSRDRTPTVAYEAGAWVVAQDDVLSHLPKALGKGKALRKGLAAGGCDIVVFIDGDVRDFSEHFVTGLLGPAADWPELTGVGQPLAGEYGGRREVLEQLPFVTHYGVTVGLLDLLSAVDSRIRPMPMEAFRRGCLPELVDHGHTGLLADPGDESGLATLLGETDAIDPAARCRVAARRFAPDVMAARYLELYRTVLTQGDQCGFW